MRDEHRGVRRAPPAALAQGAGRVGALGWLLVLGLVALELGRPGPGPIAQAAQALAGRGPAARPTQALPVIVALTLPGGETRWVRAEPPTAHAALRAAGLEALGADMPLARGQALQVDDAQVRVVPLPNPLLLGLPADPNTASTEALELLPGVGPSLAAAIVADREARGPYQRLEDLDRVRGIGPARLAQISPLLRVGAAPAGAPGGGID